MKQPNFVLNLTAHGQQKRRTTGIGRRTKNTEQNIGHQGRESNDGHGSCGNVRCRDKNPQPKCQKKHGAFSKRLYVRIERKEWDYFRSRFVT